MLCLERDRRMLSVAVPAFAGTAAIHRVAGIDLQSWLGRGDLDEPAALGIAQARGRHKVGPTVAANLKVVIVSTDDPQLLIIPVYALANLPRRGEIERRATNGAQHSG